MTNDNGRRRQLRMEHPWMGDAYEGQVAALSNDPDRFLLEAIPLSKQLEDLWLQSANYMDYSMENWEYQCGLILSRINHYMVLQEH